MKQKHTNFLQRNIEKFVILGALLIAAVLALFYVVGSPYEVEVAGQQAAPGEVEDIVNRKALSLRNAINSNDNPLPEINVPDYTERFIVRLNREIAPGAPLPTPLAEAGVPTEIFGELGTDDPTTRLVDVPTPPAPSDVRLRQGNAVLGEAQTPARQAAYERLVSAEEPRDFRYVSVTGKFDMSQWEQALRTGGTPDTRMPRQWWQGKLLLTGVVLERQRLDPRTGRWSSAQIIEPLPGAVTVATSGERLTIPQASQLLGKISQQSDVIARPEFAPLAATSPSWIRPDAEVAELSPEQEMMVRDLKQQIDRLKRQEAILEKTLPDADRDGTPGASGPRDPRLGRADRARDGAGQAGPRNRQLVEVRNQIAELERQLDQIYGITEPEGGQPQGIDAMEFLNEFDSQSPFATDGGQPFGQRDAQNRSGDGASDEDAGLIRVWAHDLTVEPGATYRYRVSVRVFNPLFLQNDLADEQKDLFFDRVSLTTSPSDWTDPVQIEENQQFFFIDPEGEQVVTELWRLFNGQWVNHRVQVAPGDRIFGVTQAQVGGATQPLEIDTGLFLLDTQESTGDTRPRGLQVLFFGEPTAGRISSRFVEEDRDSLERTRLQNRRDRAVETIEPEPVATTGGR